MSLSLRTVLPSGFPPAALAALPVCASPLCPRPPTLWQRWWARHEGVWLHQGWYCSINCFQAGVYRRLEQVALAGPVSSPRPNRLPLGLLLLSQGDISAEQLRQALQSQRSAKNGKLGEWLVKMKAVSPSQVTAALAVQQGCPVFAARQPPYVPARMHWPEALVDRYGALPAFFNPKQATLYVGFLDRVDHGFLYSLEQMLRCRTQPCIVPAGARRQYQELRSFTAEGERIEIPQRQNSIEITQTISNYAQQIHAERCSMSRCDGRLWIRLEPTHGNHVDFLFPVPSGR